MTEYQDELEYELEHIRQLPGYDPSYDLIYFNSWATYDENGWLAIFELNGQYFALENGYSSMAEGPQDETWDLIPVTENEALNLMIDFDSIAGENRPMNTNP